VLPVKVEWPTEHRIDNIGQNGNDGLHYEESKMSDYGDLREELAVKTRCDRNMPFVDVVNHPPHYTTHPSGVECIQITEHMSFNLGNALKYIWRCDLKKDAIEDLKKAQWYLAQELDKREKGR